MDTNGRVAGLLDDMASLQPNKYGERAYRRAAAAVLGLEAPLEVLWPAGGLDGLPHVGPSSRRLIAEVLRTGTAASVDRVAAERGRTADLERRRQLRDAFLSRAEVLAVLAEPLRRVPGLADLRGDFQMHSTWSDGLDSIRAMADGCLARGCTHCAITDHAHGLRIAGGLSGSDLERQAAEIDAVNDAFDGRFRVLKSVEANIGLDGGLDVAPELAARLDLLIAAPHSGLRETRDQTSRLLRAVRTPGVHVLAHPRGRKFGARAGIAADWDRVFAAAAAEGVAVEIDGDPWRQDLDGLLAREALAAGCLFAVDSDAHAVSQLGYIDTALAHARLAGIPPARIVNCWPLDDVLEWTTRGAARRPARRRRTR
ncbi:MAG: PHP domain-containing protein [Vicinamibacterales bacterium]